LPKAGYRGNPEAERFSKRSTPLWRRLEEGRVPDCFEVLTVVTKELELCRAEIATLRRALEHARTVIQFEADGQKWSDLHPVLREMDAALTQRVE
jgi:hypothetical protein